MGCIIMAANTKIVLKCVYADDTTDTVNIDGINPEVGTNPQIKTILKNFNAQSGGSLSTKMLSKNGFNWIGVKSADIITTNRVYIF